MIQTTVIKETLYTGSSGMDQFREPRPGVLTHIAFPEVNGSLELGAHWPHSEKYHIYLYLIHTFPQIISSLKLERVS